MKIFIEELSKGAVGKIERRMRSGEASETGFLGRDERLADVVARDRQTLANLAIAPEQIADRLESIVGQAHRLWELVARGVLKLPRDSTDSPVSGEFPGIEPVTGEMPGIEVEARFLVTSIGASGIQECPFENSAGTRCNGRSWASADFALKNTETKKTLRFPGLSIHLIRDHHFFEGAVPYRVDPAQAASILHLLPREDYRPKWANELTWGLRLGTTQCPDELDADDWHSMQATKQVLDEPEETSAPCDEARFYVRGNMCVVVASDSWSVPAGAVIKGAKWTNVRGYKGTWSYEMRTIEYVVPVTLESD